MNVSNDNIRKMFLDLVTLNNIALSLTNLRNGLRETGFYDDEEVITNIAALSFAYGAMELAMAEEYNKIN